MLYNYMGKGGEKNMLHIMHLHRKEPEGNALLLNVAYQVASRIYFPSPYFLFIHDFKIFNTERVRLITYQNNKLKFRGKKCFSGVINKSLLFKHSTEFQCLYIQGIYFQKQNFYVNRKTNLVCFRYSIKFVPIFTSAKSV